MVIYDSWIIQDVVVYVCMCMYPKTMRLCIVWIHACFSRFQNPLTRAYLALPDMIAFIV